MNRRHFLTSLLGGAIAAHELDIEKLLWVPGQKKIFIPPSPDIAMMEIHFWNDFAISWIHMADGTIKNIESWSPIPTAIGRPKTVTLIPRPLRRGAKPKP